MCQDKDISSSTDTLPEFQVQVNFTFSLAPSLRKSSCLLQAQLQPILGHLGFWWPLFVAQLCPPLISVLERGLPPRGTRVAVRREGLCSSLCVEVLVTLQC